MKTSPRAAKFATVPVIFWNLTHKNKSDQRQCLHFKKSQKWLNLYRDPVIDTLIK